MGVSIALATYNGAEFVKPLLASLAAQRKPPSELVVGDDGSSDDTVELVRAFSSRAPFPVRVDVNSERQGYAQNFLSIARRCNEEIVAFCDQDDVWDERKLALIGEAFAGGDDVVVVTHYANVVDMSGLSVGRRFPKSSLRGRIAGEDIPLRHFPGFSIAVRAAALSAVDEGGIVSELGAPIQFLGHDGWIWLLGACLGTTVVLPDELVSYRQHANVFGEGHAGPARMIGRALGSGGETYGRRQAANTAAAACLQELAFIWRADDRQGWAQSAEARASRYRALAAGFEARRALYGADRRCTALRTFVDLLRGGTYRDLRAEGESSGWAPLKDLALISSRRLPIRDRG